MYTQSHVTHHGVQPSEYFSTLLLTLHTLLHALLRSGLTRAMSHTLRWHRPCLCTYSTQHILRSTVYKMWSTDPTASFHFTAHVAHITLHITYITHDKPLHTCHGVPPPLGGLFPLQWSRSTHYLTHYHSDITHYCSR